jgi:hypothetical protein
MILLCSCSGMRLNRFLLLEFVCVGAFVFILGLVLEIGKSDQQNRASWWCSQCWPAV